jgi:hypothetical protein
MSVRTLRSERSASARFRQERDVDYSQIPGRAFPSRLHVLENQLAPGFSPSLSHQPASHVGCACGLRTRGMTGAQCDARVRTLSQNHVVKQQPAPSQRHSGRDTLGVGFRRIREVSRLAWAPWGWLVRLAPSEPGSSRGGYLSRTNRGSLVICATRVQLPESNGQPYAPRYISRSELSWAVPNFEFIPAA